MSSTPPEQQPSLWTNESLPLAQRKELLAEEVRRFKERDGATAASQEAAKAPSKSAPDCQPSG